MMPHSSQRHGLGVVWVTLVGALALTLVPLPAWMATLWPAWMVLAVIYWTLALPERFGLGQAWLAGLLLDAVLGGVLGQHALAMTVVAWIAQRLHLQIRPFPVWQQALVLLPLLGIYEFALYWLSGIMGLRDPVWAWPAMVTGVLLWPLTFSILRAIRQRFQIA